MNKENIILKLKEIHENDEEQINFILSDAKKIIVTANAGCGKTKTMISKIAYELVATSSMNFKKILALTFSVNAATKIKQDTIDILPKLLDSKDFNVDMKLDVSNYHSFSTKILFKHGYILNKNLKDIDNFDIFPDDSNSLKKYLTSNELSILQDFSQAINSVNTKAANNLEQSYINTLLEKLVPNEIITYNGLLVLANKLLEKQAIGNFYKLYYPIIIIDEFQDTNYLAYKIITSLIHDDNRIILMGDDIQQIYRFLGAIPNLFQIIEKKYDMIPMRFNTNYRFKDNLKMKKLDYYLREVFRNYGTIENFDEKAEINLGLYETDDSEVEYIVSNMKDKIEQGNKVALLVNMKGSAEKVIEKLEYEGIKYFNGLFTDTDPVYITFHRVALEIFFRKSGTGKSTSRQVINDVIKEIRSIQVTITPDDIIFNSLMLLLTALFGSIRKSHLSKEDKYRKITFTLDNNSLKRLMNEIDENIVLTTIHASKGLEWDYVYITEVTKSQFPFYYALCQQCKTSNSGIEYGNYCEFTFPDHLESEFKEQLSLFYVGVTRAKKDVFLSSNIDKNRYGYPKKISCLTALPNLKTIGNF